MKKIVAILLIIASVGSLFAMGAKDEEAVGSKEIVPSGKVIRVGVITGTASAVPNYRAIKEGYYDELGLEVEVYDFANGVLINEAFAAGELEMALNGFAAAYSMSTGEYKYLSDGCAVADHGIWVRPDSPLLTVQGEFSKENPEIYGNKETAKGLKIFCQLGSITQIMIDSYMKQLGNDDYGLIGMDVGASLNALISGEGDGAALYPPTSSQAEQSGLVEVGRYDVVCGGPTAELMMCTSEMYEKRYGDVILLMKGYYKAAAELQADDDKFYKDGMDLFAEQGTEYADRDMRQLIAAREFFTAESFTTGGYRYGHHVSFTMSALIDLGKLQEGSIDVFKESICPEAVKEVFGVEPTVGFFE